MPCKLRNQDHDILGYRHYLSERGKVADYARKCEAAVTVTCYHASEPTGNTT